MPGTDFHQHVWPDEFRRLLERRTEPPYLRGHRLVLPRGGSFEVDPGPYSPEARIAELDRAGLDRAVISLPPTTEPTVDLVDEWHAAALDLERATGGRLVPLAYADSDPAFTGAVIPAWALEASAGLLTRLEARGGIVFVHPGPAARTRPTWRAAGVSYTQQVLDAYAGWIGGDAGRWPRLRVVFALLGGGAAFHLERFAARGLDAREAFVPDVWFETSSYGERAIELTLQTFGAGRLLFGSDAPVDRLHDALAQVRRFGPALESEVLISNPITVLSAERHRWAA